MMKKLTLRHIGRDDWDRPVYECDDQLYVDVSPRKSCKPEICTKQGNIFHGEPQTPIAEGIEIEFSPCRDTWDF